MGGPAEQIDDSSNQYPRWLMIIPAAAVLLVFGRAVGHEFVDWDDYGYIVNNPFLGEITWRNICAILTPGRISAERLYIPITYLSLIGGQSSGFVHAVNILLHAANAVLVFRLALVLRLKPFPASIAALLFALHPLQVESVAWAMGRKDLLCGLFMLAAMLIYIRWSVDGKWWQYLAAAIVFVLAMLAKPVAIMLPFALALVILYRGDARQKRLWLGLVPLLVAGTAILILTARTDSSTPLDLHLKLMFAAYLPSVLNEWLGRIFLLSSANPHYLTSSLDPANISVIACMPLFLLCGAIYVAARLRVHIFWFGFAFAAVLGVPAAAILVSQSREFYTADRYGYLALAGAAILVAAVLHRAWRVGEGRMLRARRIVLDGFLIIQLLICALSSSRLTMAWRNTESLFTYAANVNSDNHLAWTFLGTVAFERDDHGLAARCYRRAIQANIGHATAWHNLGAILAKTEPVPEQELASARRMEAFSRYGAPAHMAFLQGQRWERKRQSKQARASYESAVRNNPRHSQAQFRLGVVLHRDGDLEGAFAAYQSAVKVDPRLSAGWYNMGRIHMGSRRFQPACEAFAMSAKLNPNDADTQIQLGQAFLAAGDPRAALAPLKRAGELNPGLGIIDEFLTRAYLGVGDTRTAIVHAEAAISKGHSLAEDLQKQLAPHLK